MGKATVGLSLTNLQLASDITGMRDIESQMVQSTQGTRSNRINVECRIILLYGWRIW